MADPVLRAASLISSNRYLTLATFSSEGPWAAPLNYVVGPAQQLIFYSARESRHARHLFANTSISGAIFNSAASSEDVDGMQFTGICKELGGPQLAEAHEQYFQKNFGADERDWWLRPIKAFSKDGPSVFFGISLSAAWVIDLDSVESSRIDRRLELSCVELWDLLDGSVEA